MFYINQCGQMFEGIGFCEHAPLVNLNEVAALSLPLRLSPLALQDARSESQQWSAVRSWSKCRYSMSCFAR